MNHKQIPVTLSTLDEERFGIKTAKALEARADNISEILEFCRKNKVELLIVRCPTSDRELTHKMESMGFLLMDTLIYYECNLKKNPPPEYVSEEITIRPFKTGEEDIIKSISAEAFEGYFGHYHADTRLDQKKCNEVYSDWAYKSCFSKAVADEVFIAEYKGKIIGFGTVRGISSGEGEYIIAGVLRAYQGLGAYRLILINCMRWCVERGLDIISTSTQIPNLAVQKVWIRLGFKPIRSYHTFHKWFDSKGK